MKPLYVRLSLAFTILLFTGSNNFSNAQGGGGPCIDSMTVLCTKILPIPVYGLEYSFWAFSFNYNGSSGSDGNVSLAHSPIGGGFTTTYPFGYGLNRIMIFGAVADSLGYNSDTAFISVTDSLTGDVCTVPLALYSGTDSSYFFANCSPDSTTLTNGKIYCVEGGEYSYMATLTVNNDWDNSMFYFMPYIPSTFDFAETNGGLITRGTTNDTVYFELDGTNMDSVTFYYIVFDSTTLCPLCQIPYTIPIPQLGSLQFTSADTVLCSGDTFCYHASAANSQSIYYAIDSGEATIDSVSGCVSNAISSFRIRAIAQGVTNCQTDTSYLNVKVPVEALHATNGIFFCDLGNKGVISLLVTGDSDPYSFAWSNSDSAQNISDLGEGIYTVTLTDKYGCATTLSDTLSCVPGCGIDSLHLSCQVCNYEGINAKHFWTINFNSGYSNGSKLKVLTKHSTLDSLYYQPLQPGNNSALILTESAIDAPFNFDTLTITVIDSALGDTCIQYLPVSLHCTYSDFFQPCLAQNLAFSNSAVTCTGLNFVSGLPIYRLTQNVTNNFSNKILASVIDCISGTCSTINEPKWYSPGNNSDTVYFTVDSLMQNSACLVFGTTDTTLCQGCSQYVCVQLPVPVAPVFTSTITLLCKRENFCYEAISPDNATVHYSIVSGTATVDSLTGCVTNALSDFILRATAYEGCVSASTDLPVTVSPHAFVSPADTTIWVGDTVQLNAGGGTAYSWPVLGLSMPTVNVIPGSGSTNYEAIVTTPYNCTDTVHSLVVTVDTLILSIQVTRDTLAPGENAQIQVSSNLPGTTFSWTRNDTTNVSGYSSGVGSIVNCLLVNNTSTWQTVTFTFKGNYQGHGASRTIQIVEMPNTATTVHVSLSDSSYAPGPPLFFGLLGGNVNARYNVLGCDSKDTLTITTTLDNLSIGQTYNIVQILPASTVNTYTYSYTCGTAPVVSSDSLTWNFVAGDTSCVLTIKTQFGCEAGANIITTTGTGGGLHYIDTTPLNIVQPVVVISPDTIIPVLIGQGISRPWKICAFTGALDNLTISYFPEDAINEVGASPIELMVIQDTNILGVTRIIPGITTPKTIFNSDTSAAFVTIFSTNGYSCVYVLEIDTPRECYSAEFHTTSKLYASSVCSTRGSCASSGDSVHTRYNVSDDFTTIDNSPLQIPAFALIQTATSGGKSSSTDVTSRGFTVCNPTDTTETFGLRYTVFNPVRSTKSIAQNANYKGLEQFTTFIDKNWFFVNGLIIKLYEDSAGMAGSNFITLTSSNYTVDSSGQQKSIAINFESISDTDLQKLFYNDSAVFMTNPTAPAYRNAMKENVAFIISIEGLMLNANDSTNADLQLCGPLNNYIVGGPNGVRMSYRTMCDHYEVLNYQIGSYLNNSNAVSYGTASPNMYADNSSPPCILTFDWEQYAGSGDPWAYVSGTDSFFNCPAPYYEVVLKVPSYVTIDTSSAQFSDFIHGGHTAHITCHSISTIYDSLLEYIFADSVTPSGQFTCASTVNIDAAPGCADHDGGFVYISAQLEAACSKSCNYPLFCLGSQNNVLQYQCGGGCSGTGVATNSILINRAVIYPAPGYAGSGFETSRAYPCDDIQVVVEGQTQPGDGVHGSDYYLQFGYSPFSALLNNSLFSLATDVANPVEYSLDNITYFPITNLVNPSTHVSGLVWDADSGKYIIDAHIPPGALCDTCTTNVQFWVRLTLSVNSNLPYSNGHEGIYQLEQLQAILRLIDSGGYDHASCNSVESGFLLLAHQYVMTERFIAPDDQIYGAVPICTQRLLVTANAYGGLPQTSEMPNELRPLMAWPDTINLTNLGDLTINAAKLTFLQGNNISTPPVEVTDTVGFANNAGAGTALVSGIPRINMNADSAFTWPLVSKWGSDYMNLLVTFNRTSCAITPLYPYLHFNYWVRGANEAFTDTTSDSCASFSDYLNGTVKRPIDTCPTYIIPNAFIGSSSSYPTVAFPSDTNLTFTSPTFTFQLPLTYTGPAGGVANTYLYLPDSGSYVSPLNKFTYFILDTSSNSGDTIRKGIFYSLGPLESLNPPKTDTFTFVVHLNQDSTCKTGSSFSVYFNTGYSCSDTPSKPPMCNEFETLYNYNIFPQEIITFSVPTPTISVNCDTCNYKVLGEPCTDAGFSFVVTAQNANVQNPSATLTVPDSLMLIEVTTSLGDSSIRWFDTLTSASPPFNFQPYFDTLLSHCFHQGEYYLPVGSTFRIYAIYIRQSLYTGGQASLLFKASGKDLCGKPVSDSVFAVYNFNPLVISSLNYSNNCSTGALTLTCTGTGGDGEHKFHWSTGDTTATIHRTDTIGGVYTVILTDHEGCSVADTASITVPGWSHLKLTDSVPYSSGLSEIFLHVSGGTSPYHYHWGRGDTTQIIDSLIPGIYSVTVTDKQNCTAVLTDTIPKGYPYGACFFHPGDKIYSLTGDTIYSDSLYKKVTGTTSNDDTLNGVQVYIFPNQILIVRHNLVFEKCEVVGGFGSSIVVAGSGDSLQIYGSTLKGCDSMWNGIEVGGLGTLLASDFSDQSSNIEDAYYGIAAAGEVSSLHVSNTNFNHNGIGVLLYAYEGDNIDISGCYFGMDTASSMLPPYGYQRPEAGIDIQFCWDTISIPNPAFDSTQNTFKGLNNGIEVFESNLSVLYNNFDSIKHFDSTLSSGAVFDVGASYMGATNLFVRTSYLPVDTSSTIRFNNCDVGVHGFATKVRVEKNRMENVGTGIRLESALGALVDSNYINHTNFGVALQEGEKATQLVQSNTIYVNDPPAPVERIGGPYIVYPNTFGVSQTEQINIIPGSTTISYNSIFNGRSSITLTNANGTIVNDNTLHQSSRASIVNRVSGIYAQNSLSLQVAENYTDGIGSGFYLTDTILQSIPISQKAGIWFNNSQNSRVFCNTLGSNDSINGLNLGMVYTASCTNVEVFNDTMNKSNYGIYLEAAGISPVLSNQGSDTLGYSNGNCFNGNGDSIHTFSNDNSFRTYTFEKAANYNPPTFWFTGDTSFANPQWTHPSGADSARAVVIANHLTIVDSSRGCGIRFHSIGPHSGGHFEMLVAEDSASYLMEPGYDSTGRWLAEKTLFRELAEDTSLRNSDSLFQAFYAKVDTEDIGKIYALENVLNELAGTTPEPGEDIDPYAVLLSEALSMNSAIPTTNAQAANFKSVTDIYLSQLNYGTDTFTSSQVSYLYGMAQLCPYSAGDAVYAARALYARIDNTVFFDDRDACAPPDSSFRSYKMDDKSADTTAKQAVSEFVNLYPNPAKDEINLIYAAKTKGQVYFEMVDQLGETIKEEKIPDGVTFEKYSTGNISSGIYHWRLRDSERTIQSGKIVIIK